METIIIDGRRVAAEMQSELMENMKRLKNMGITPRLAVVSAGTVPASDVYVRNLIKRCRNTGAECFSSALPSDVSQSEMEADIVRLNDDCSVHGVMIQMPLPSHLDALGIKQSVSPLKDIDGCHPENQGRLMTDSCFMPPCTAAGIMQLFDRYSIPLKGRHAVIIGRSSVVGKPLAMMLLNRDATVTVCHSSTEDLDRICLNADILVSAVGKPSFISGHMLKDGCTVIDVGINVCQDGSIKGDVIFDEAVKKCRYITPVPGGVGALTTVMAVKNLLTAAEKS